MSNRTRVRWRPDGTRYEVDENAPAMRTRGPYVMPDLDRAYGGQGFKSPVSGEQIQSRSQLREHNKRHNVEQCGDVTLEQQTAMVEQHYAEADGPTPGVDFQWTKPE